MPYGKKPRKDSGKVPTPYVGMPIKSKPSKGGGKRKGK